MLKTSRRIHWENIYKDKNVTEFSWFQKKPFSSLLFLKKFKLPKTAKIIDVGGGDSFFADNLIELGYKNITVLDISKNSLERAKLRLGESAKNINWINEDIVKFRPTEEFDLWHDRAAFHFLTEEKEIDKYISTVKKFVKPGGYLVIGTFSEKGPDKCSGLRIKKYSENSITYRFKDIFKKIKCITVNHKTPLDTMQNFIFCSFQKQSSV